MLFLVFKGEEVGEGCLVVCLGTSGRRKLGMVPYIAIIFMRFGLAGAKRCGRRFKVINRGGNACSKRETLTGMRGSPYVILLY